MATLKVYADRRSQPTRAIILFCKVNDIEFEEVETRLFSDDLQSPEYQEKNSEKTRENYQLNRKRIFIDLSAINPMKKVPEISHGDFTLFESHAILMYLACSYHVPDHWYPSDLCKRAKLQSLLDWHHSYLRYGSMGYLVNTVLAQFLGKLPNHDCAADCEKKLVESFSTIEKVWLKDDTKFLLGNDQPSIADLSFASEIMQLHMLPDEERNRLIGPYKKVQQWVENVKEATNPHFDEVHKYLFDVIATLKQKA